MFLKIITEGALEGRSVLKLKLPKACATFSFAAKIGCTLFSIEKNNFSLKLNRRQSLKTDFLNRSDSLNKIITKKKFKRVRAVRFWQFPLLLLPHNALLVGFSLKS